ncbi:MAG: hypothetical protein ACJA0M_000852, partial [Chitinophagales bacterium]
MATSNLIATVIAVVGEALARNPNGEIRELSAGGVLYEGDTLVTRAGSEVELRTVDGARYDLKKPTVLLVTNDFLVGDGPLVDETELDAATIDIFEREFGTDGLFSFREPDSDADDLLRDSFTEGHNFFRLGRIYEPLSPLSFDADTGLSRELPIFDSGVTSDLPDSGQNLGVARFTTDRAARDDSVSDSLPGEPILPTPEVFNVTQFTDNFVNGIQYKTSSGVEGLTGDAGDPGSFSYRDGDTITFSVGDVIIGQFSSGVIQNDLIFLQDIAGTALSDSNSNHVENMAIFLQALDSDLQDSSPSDGLLQTSDIQNSDASYDSFITITQATRDAFTGYVDPTTNAQLNIATSGKEMISQALGSVGIEFIRESERHPSEQNVFETVAMEHVAGTIQELAGNRAPASANERLVDGLEVPGAQIKYNYNEIGNEITFTANDLLVGAVAQQVVTENLVVSNLRLSAAYAAVGTIEDRGNGDYAIVLNAGVDQYDLEGLSLDYRVEDWTVFRDVSSATQDQYKSHLSADIPDVIEDSGFNQFTLISELVFDTDSTLKINFTSEAFSASLGYPVAEYADDYLVPAEYSNDGGLTWTAMQQTGVEYNSFGVPRALFGFVLEAGNDSIEIRVPIFDDVKVEPTEYFDAIVSGDRVYNEHLQFAIIDNDPVAGAPVLPQLSIDFVYVIESQGEAVFTVSLSPVATGPVTVEYDITGLAAIAGQDYVDSAGTLTFAEGQTEAFITIPIIDDLIVESDPNPELAVVTLSNATNAVIADAQGTLRIFDNDGAFDTAVTITLDPIAADDIIDATERGDVIAVGGVVDPGVLTYGIVIVTINGVDYNTRMQADRTFTVDVAGSVLVADADLTVDAVVYAFGDGQQGTANTARPYTLVDLSITVGDVTVEEGSNAEFTVDFSGARAGSFEISLSS